MPTPKSNSDRQAEDADESGAERHVLDYELADSVTADSPEQLKALGDRTRTTILSLLLERAATTSQLAVTLGKPKGTVGYHLKVLERAGLIRVVRRRKVRALTEKYYGRTGRAILIAGLPDENDPFFMLNEAMREARIEDGELLPMFTIRKTRLSEARAAEFAQRVVELADEFAAAPRSGDTVFGLVAGVYPTDLPTFDEDGGET